MSFFKRMFGLQSADELKAEADAAFDGGNWGTAKLAYEKALDKSRAASDGERKELEARIGECRDGIADDRIAQATEHIETRQLDLARSELEGALEVAASDETAAEAQKLLDRLESTDAVETAAAVDTETTDEERLALIAGTWEEPQAREYESYGETFENAILAMHGERGQEARDTLEELLEQTDEPRYLWLEVGRARLLTDDEEGGTDALRTFLGELTEGEGGDARLAAHLELASLANDRDEGDEAIAEYEAAIEAMEGDPRPYLALGRYLRERGHPGEAAQVLEVCLEEIESSGHWRVLQELGLAQAEAERTDQAIETLEGVISHFTSNRVRDFPPDATRRLAELYEGKGRIERAADLYQQLTRSSDANNHPRYHFEAGRLLWELDLADEAKRMLKRAVALMEDDADLRAEAQALLGKLDESETESESESEAR